MIFSNDYEPLSQVHIRPATHRPGLTLTILFNRLNLGVECCCTTDCDDQCLNRVSKIECCEMGSSSLCGLGRKTCSNRQFANRSYVNVQPFRVIHFTREGHFLQEGSMGWGLRALEDVSQGSLVIEYVGEVISLEQMKACVQI
jgi:SET domain-containing protein